VRILMLGDARTEHLARWVRHFRRRGDTVWAVSVQAPEFADIVLKPPVRRSFVAYPLLVPVLRRLVAEHAPDLIVAHYLPNYGLMAVLSGFRPHVIVGWGSDLLVLPQRGFLQRARLRLVAVRGQAFLVDAQMLVEPLVRLGAAEERIHVCPFGVDDDVVSAGLGARRPTANFPVILCNRRHEHAYRIDLFLAALKLLRNERSRFTATIGNSGSLTPSLVQQADVLGLSAMLTWNHAPSCAHRCAYVRSLLEADVYVSPSPTDSTSVSLLEAMAAGLAVVVPNIPGNREWVTDGTDGLLYPAGNAHALAARLAELVSDPGRCVALGRRARATIEQRGRWTTTIRTAERLFDELVS
jgi:glycosyltransferase involved in cell wall biosynthesis